MMVTFEEGGCLINGEDGKDAKKASKPKKASIAVARAVRT
ncbi:hypothetical protein LYNGBM3L_68610 [Moorena producens 3L]|uniref:Uncharacterized protein n=1 Tax=Moorena producens 3L TaxID=489825 RepID=F4Y2W6_9CYAN|nr:hypothetical protein LYNGBM3L_68610 [Moorena producens 3L]